MRWEGALLLIAAFALFGINSARELRSRIRALRDISAALELLYAELELRAAPLPEAVERTARNAAGKGREMFLCLFESLSDLGENSFSDLWTDSVRHNCRQLRPRDLDELQRLGVSLGRYELSTQLREIRACIAFLSGRQKEAERVFPSEQRLWIGLSTAAGCFLAILLL